MENQKIGDYTIKHILGDGTVAEVWYAENKIGKSVAIKVLKNRYVDTEYAKAFEIDAERMVRLSHPHIRQIYDLLMFENRPAMVMEYLDGVDLGSYLKKGELFADALLFRWWNQAVNALNYAHRQGVVHRNIKPSNIFITKHGELKLLDFDVACVKTAGRLPETRNPLEAVMYMSPEQVQENEPLTHKTDAYSLAVVFYHALQRKAPYSVETDTRYTAIQRIVSEPLGLSHLPEVWRGVLDNYLQKNPSERSKPIVAQDTDKKYLLQPLEGNRKWRGGYVLLGVSCIVLLSLLAMWWLFSKPPQKHLPTQIVDAMVMPEAKIDTVTAPIVYSQETESITVENPKASDFKVDKVVSSKVSRPKARPMEDEYIHEDFRRRTSIPQAVWNDVASTTRASRYDHVGEPRYGLSVAISRKKWGLVDKNGTLVIPLKYDWIFVEKENFIRVKSDGKEFIINRQGVCIKDCP